MTHNKRQPRQSVELDEAKIPRFRENKIVRYLLDQGDLDMNDLAFQEFSDEDREQFAQLIGYSVSGFGDLSYASDEVYEAACEEADSLEQRSFTVQEKALGLVEMGATAISADIVTGLLDKIQALEETIEEQQERLINYSWQINPERMGR